MAHIKIGRTELALIFEGMARFLDQEIVNNKDLEAGMIEARDTYATVCIFLRDGASFEMSAADDPDQTCSIKD